MMQLKTDIEFRKNLLIRLLHQIKTQEDEIILALKNDFNKPEFEAVVTETSYVISDLKNTINNIKRWAKPKLVLPYLINFPTLDYIYKEPFGKVLIISPWNYPFQLAICPLVAAIAAGNTVVLKPSELTPNTAAIIEKIISLVFSTDIVTVIQGDATVSQELLTKRWDYIFFTGSVTVGKIIAEAAAKNLTPTTLELGGKNPCIVDETANLELAAKRIVWGKFINAGQVCISPDYLLVHQSCKQSLIEFLKIEITKAFTENPELSADFARIINVKNWSRLVALMDSSKIIFGGQLNKETNFISPTLIDESDLDSAIMQEEIFGPLLPILSYNDETDIQNILTRFEKPLALYVFSSKSKFYNKIISNFSFGGGCINDTIIQFSNKRLPFGGVGHSGMGAYHGKLGFDTFSHKKAIIKKSNWLDLPFRYAPYNGKLALVKRILNWFG